FDQEWLYGMSLLAEASVLAHDNDVVPDLYRQLRPWSAFNAVDLSEGFRGSVSRYLGLLAAAMGRVDDARRHFEDALAMAEEMGARPWLAHTQHDYARLLLVRGSEQDQPAALDLREKAIASYRQLGMDRWADRAVELR